MSRQKPEEPNKNIEGWGVLYENDNCNKCYKGCIKQSQNPFDFDEVVKLWLNKVDEVVVAEGLQLGCNWEPTVSVPCCKDLALIQKVAFHITSEALYFR